MNNLKLACKCGKVQGVLQKATAKEGIRLVCYCDDCQAFAHYLSNNGILDANNGTELFQVSYANVEILKGTEYLSSIKLTEKGMIRWYTACCKTPIGNTVSAKQPFIGLIHTFFDGAVNRDTTLGPIWAHTSIKKDSPAAHLNTPVYTIIPRIVQRLITWKLRDSLKKNPFFTSGGEPASEPKILAKS